MSAFDPAIEHDAPVLRHHRRFPLPFDVHPRADDQHGNERVVVAVFDAQEGSSSDNGSTAGPVSNIELMCYPSRACPVSFPSLLG